MVRPAAGLLIAFFWAEVILGGRKPLVVLVTSNCADGWILAVGTPIPTCAVAANANRVLTVANSSFTFVIVV